MKNQKTILVVEDDKSLSSVLEAKLGEDNYGVVVCKNGQEALDYLVDSKPDLIILDIIMPVMDGHEFFDKVKENAKTSNIPVIFLTNLGNEEDHENCGAEEYIIKSNISVEDLLERIKSFL